MEKIKITDDILVKYFTNEAEPHEVSLIFQWREANSDNEKKFVQYEKIWTSSAQSNKDISLDEDLAWQKIQSKMNAPQKGKVVVLYTRWLVAASIILIIGMAAFIFNFISQNNMIEVALLTAKQGHQSATLPDGTNVVLKNGTLQYNTKFAGSKRQVKLDSGIAFFKVAKNKEIPFEISTHNTLVTVVGTQFEISSNYQFIQVLVTEGKVIFKTPEGEKVLTQGMGAKFNRRNNKLENFNAFTPNNFAYSSGILNFNNTSLKNVVEDLNTFQSEYKIAIENSEINNCKITTVFEKANLEDILLVISSTLNLEIEKKEDNKTIILKGKKCIE